jgi:uncharacterized protein (DUF433 family)
LAALPVVIGEGYHRGARDGDDDRKGMGNWEPAAYGKYKWIVQDPDLLGGKLAVRDTRLSVSFVLACLAEGMSAEEIAQTYAPFPQQAIPELMKLASELLDSGHVAA